MLARVALDTRPGPSARGGELARLPAGEGLLDRAVDLTATDLGVALTRASTAEPVAARADGRGRDADRGRVARLRPRAGRRTGAARSTRAASRCAEPDPDRERLAILDAELGASRAAEIAPRFDARRHVRFASAWASARWDLVTAYHDALAGRLSGEALSEEVDRLAAHAAEPPVAATAAWLAARADAAGRGDVAEALARLTATPALSSAPTPAAAPSPSAVPATAPAGPSVNFVVLYTTKLTLVAPERGRRCPFRAFGRPSRSAPTVFPCSAPSPTTLGRSMSRPSSPPRS